MDIILSKNAFTLCWKRNGFFCEPLRGATLRSGYLASRYAVLEASASRYNRWEASATSSSQNLIILSVCV